VVETCAFAGCRAGATEASPVQFLDDTIYVPLCAEHYLIVHEGGDFDLDMVRT